MVGTKIKKMSNILDILLLVFFDPVGTQDAMFEKTVFFNLFPVIQKFAVLKSERRVAYDWSIRLGVRSLQGPTNSTSSTVGIRLGVRSLQGPTSSTVGIF